MQKTILSVTYLVCGLSLCIAPHASASEWEQCALRLTADNVRATATFVQNGPEPEYFIVTAYHAIRGRTSLHVAASTYRNVNIVSLTDSGSVFYADPAHDLAIFRISSSGARILKEEMGRIALPLADSVVVGSWARVVGNPKLRLMGSESTPINLLALAAVSRLAPFNAILPPEFAQGSAKWTEVLLLESIHVTHGFSGGPVLVAGPGGDKDRRVAGIVQGGIGRQFTSWAVSAMSVRSSLRSAEDQKRFAEYPPEEWPDLLIDVPQSYSGSSDFWELIDHAPSQGIGTARVVPLVAGKSTELSVTLRVSDRVSAANPSVIATIMPSEWLTVEVSPSVKELLRKDNLVKFQWTLKPSKDVVGRAPTTIEFRTGDTSEAYSLELATMIIRDDGKPLPQIIATSVAGALGIATLASAVIRDDKLNTLNDCRISYGLVDLQGEDPCAKAQSDYDSADDKMKTLAISTVAVTTVAVGLWAWRYFKSRNVTTLALDHSAPPTNVSWTFDSRSAGIAVWF